MRNEDEEEGARGSSRKDDGSRREIIMAQGNIEWASEEGIEHGGLHLVGKLQATFFPNCKVINTLLNGPKHLLNKHKRYNTTFSAM